MLHLLRLAVLAVLILVLGACSDDADDASAGQVGGDTAPDSDTTDVGDDGSAGDAGDSDTTPGDAEDTRDTADVSPPPPLTCRGRAGHQWADFDLESTLRVESVAAITRGASPIVPTPIDPPTAQVAYPVRALLARGETAVPVLITRYSRGADAWERDEIGALDLARLVDDPDVEYIGLDVPARPLVDHQRAISGTDAVHEFSIEEGRPVYGGWIGRGVTVQIADTGVDADHPDFQHYNDADEAVGSRITGAPPEDDSNHGTSVGGVIFGSGHNSANYELYTVQGEPFQFRGHAPGVEQVFSVLFNNFDLPFAGMLDGRFHISNHSHTQSDGTYGPRVRYWDRLVVDGYGGHPPRPLVFGAANNGGGTSSELLPGIGYYSILAPSKNAITVGGLLANDGRYASGASMGPTLDGRLKPDLVAPGWKDFAPINGQDITISEIRIVAAADSGAQDIVWTPQDETGWTRNGRYAEGVAEPDGLRAQVYSNSDDSFVYSAPAGIVTEDYVAVRTRFKIAFDDMGGLYRHPRFWWVRWDTDPAEEGFEQPGYPRFDLDNIGPGFHEHIFEISEHQRWEGTVYGLKISPTTYDDRINSTRVGGLYGRSVGTSLAAPAVSGVIALMLEAMRELNGVDIDAAPPAPATFRALLTHTARDMVSLETFPRQPDNHDTGEPVIYPAGPDFSTGWGHLDTERAVSLVEAHADGTTRYTEQTLNVREEHVYEFIAHPEGGPLKATLAWDDPPATPVEDPTESNLYHDLDVVLIGPDGDAYGPWVLDPLPFDVATWFASGTEPITTADIQPARRCVTSDYWAGDSTRDCEDHLNNIEQVLVDAPTPGTWTLRIRATSLRLGQQKYSLVVTQDCL